MSNMGKLRGILGSDSGFGAIVGNPPYQHASGKTSIYQGFIRVGILLGGRLSLITPHRWGVQGHTNSVGLRDYISSNGLDFYFSSYYWWDSESVFSSVRVGGGVSAFLFDGGVRGDTTFYSNFKKIGSASLFSETGVIDLDFRGRELVERVSGYDNGIQFSVMANGVTDVFRKVFGSGSIANVIENTAADRVSGDDIAVRFPRGLPVRFARREWFDDSGFCPEGYCGLGFSKTGDSDTIVRLSRTSFLLSLEAEISCNSIFVDSLEKLLNIYKYSRTKLFAVLVRGRVSSHNIYKSVYSDVPWGFKFDETDPVDWSGTVEEIDKELESYFGLGDFHDYIQEVERPFSRVFKDSDIVRLDRELGYSSVDSGLFDWYGESLV